MTPADVAARLKVIAPGLRWSGPWIRLGGNVNHVWRVGEAPHTVIVKRAPPHVAAAPALALSTARSALEADALRLLGAGGALADALGPGVRVPRVIAADPEHALLVIEDLGACADLGAALRERPELAGRLADLGGALGRLHARSAGSAELSRRFANADVQRVREAVQYAAVGALLERAGTRDAAALGERAAALGRALRAPGRCLVMGDLWPPSVLVLPGEPARLALIDWEFVHFGRPLQDVAHLCAHLWMHAERAPSPRAAAAFRAALQAFLASYAAERSAAPGLWDARELEAAGVHLGCEVLMRTLGPFQAGYLYDGLAPDAPAIRAAVSRAAEWIRNPQRAEPLAALQPTPPRGRAG